MPSPHKAVFYDPERKRWRRTRRALDALGIAITVIITVFVYTLARGGTLPGLQLPEAKRPYHPIVSKERIKAHAIHRRKLNKPASTLTLNADEGVRAAFYVNWDAASFSSLKEYAHQIDLLYPEWLHVITPDGKIRGVTPANELFDVIGPDARVHAVDDRVMPMLKALKSSTEVFPLVNNYDPSSGKWIDTVGEFLNNTAARTSFREQLISFLNSGDYKGVSIDFEEIPGDAQPAFRQLIAELDLTLRPSKKIFINVPVDDDDFDYRFLAQHSDGLILMLYDQHQSESLPGPVAAQEWFVKNLQTAVKQIPREKIICAIGAYGYDWTTTKDKNGRPKVESVSNLTAQEAWITSQDSESPVVFDPDSLNPHYAYEDERELRHDVWFLDGVTALNQMRAARMLGIDTFALWRLGSEDRSLWAIWDQPVRTEAQKLTDIPPGQDVDYEGAGEIIRVTGTPKPGTRKLTEDTQSRLITDEKVTS
ncbi:MAG: polysaccharide deacetylase, partial [Acidobacteriales bacterium]|nr:polysaccharide deacetylase [Terriglobales bacterium]